MPHHGGRKFRNTKESPLDVGRIMVIDECLDFRIAQELESRGRDAVSTKKLGLLNLLDVDLLRCIGDKVSDPWVLVTKDDKMPDVHEKIIQSLKISIAITDSSWEKCCLRNNLDLDQEAFIRESIHRWAHVISEQPLGEIRRYTPIGHGLWRSRKKPLSPKVI